MRSKRRRRDSGGSRFSLVESSVRNFILLDIQEVLSGCSSEEAGRVLSRASQDIRDTLSRTFVDEGETYLTEAVKAGDAEKVAVLAKYLSVRVQNISGETPLYAACVGGRWEVAAFLARKDPLALNMRTRRGFTPLMEAAHRGHVSTIELMLSRGAHTHIQDHDHNTALTWAALERQQKALVRLIQGHPRQFSTLQDHGQHHHHPYYPSPQLLELHWASVEELKLSAARTRPGLAGSIQAGVKELAAGRIRTLRGVFAEVLPKDLVGSGSVMIIASFMCPSVPVVYFAGDQEAANATDDLDAMMPAAGAFGGSSSESPTT
eukprot:CAMPEP_0170170562 /NCGR_PEP_ID=MMETSP0040_2-20121228/3556_1 /TAXON_ID=641309 /ORGANISM="Lotharella oceanica, Strain CCMP622" /LENGTH=319 /DNA_ID=CAMNT_0010410041 /DNA_START=20 /DNA_END=979 /DNA_ORIENTATION=-